MDSFKILSCMPSFLPLVSSTTWSPFSFNVGVRTEAAGQQMTRQRPVVAPFQHCRYRKNDPLDVETLIQKAQRYLGSIYPVSDCGLSSLYLSNIHPYLESERADREATSRRIHPNQCHTVQSTSFIGTAHTRYLTGRSPLGGEKEADMVASESPDNTRVQPWPSHVAFL